MFVARVIGSWSLGVRVTLVTVTLVSVTGGLLGLSPLVNSGVTVVTGFRVTVKPG